MNRKLQLLHYLTAYKILINRLQNVRRQLTVIVCRPIDYCELQVERTLVRKPLRIIGKAYSNFIRGDSVDVSRGSLVSVFK